MRNLTFEKFIRFEASDEYPSIAFDEGSMEDIEFKEVEGELYTDESGVEHVLIERRDLMELLDAKTMEVRDTYEVQIVVPDSADRIEVTMGDKDA